MTEPASRQPTYQDLLEVPEGFVAEILNGVLETHPRPAPRHARASSALGMELGAPFDRGKGGPGGWLILDEPELHLGSDVIVPDLAGWRTERMPQLPGGEWLELAPDWACEVLSPATQRTDRVIKMPLYAKHGVMHLWLIDPDSRILEAYVLRSGAWTLIKALADDQSVSVPPFEAVEFPLDALWAP